LIRDRHADGLAGLELIEVFDLLAQLQGTLLTVRIFKRQTELWGIDTIFPLISEVSTFTKAGLSPSDSMSIGPYFAIRPAPSSEDSAIAMISCV
jgi:hypothetical protein